MVRTIIYKTEKQSFLNKMYFWLILSYDCYYIREQYTQPLIFLESIHKRNYHTHYIIMHQLAVMHRTIIQLIHSDSRLVITFGNYMNNANIP